MRKEIEEIFEEWGLNGYGRMVTELHALFESKLEEAKRPTVQQLIYIPDHEKLRREHWSRAYVRFMELFRDAKDAEPFADRALEAFDNKFNPHQP